MKNTIELTAKELETVKRLIFLGDSKELAIKTVVENREDQAIRESQLADFCKIND
jgi:hypothetical protein